MKFLLLSLLAVTGTSSLNVPRQAPSSSAITATRTATASSGGGAQATAYRWQSHAAREFPIHSSCNATERNQLKKALDEVVKLAQQAKEHVLRFGNSSTFYTKYFGKAPTAEVIGWYDRVVSGDRSGVLFRCDNIDGNCALPGWGGHWRGENGTQETVICPLSYVTRRPLEQMCSQGYDVASGALSFYFGSDLLHRLYHLPAFGENTVSHYADTYAECLALAQTKPEQTVRNSHTLQYFALDVYAYDIAVPGEGCSGRMPSALPAVSSAMVTMSASKSSSAAAAAAATSAPPTKASVTASAAKSCHTHADGEEHCI